jgi:hypothetical protein
MKEWKGMQKECIEWCNWFQKNCTRKPCFSWCNHIFIMSIWGNNKSYENSKSWNFGIKGCKGNDYLLNHLASFLYSLG